MRLKKLHIKEKGFKNLNNIEINFEQADGITVLIGNNGSGKSNLLEAISNIFAHLYKKSDNLKPEFNYELSYQIDGNTILIDFNEDSYTYKLNDQNISLIEERYLPVQVIANYSGEESRLWETFYKPFYDDYTSGLKDGSQSFPKQQLMFVNKYYWNIALLTFFFYDFEGETPNIEIRDFCRNTLGIAALNKIYFEFDTKQISKWKANPIKSFVETINPENKSKIEYTFSDFKDIIPETAQNNQRYLFNLLAGAFMPKDDKLITKIDLFYGDENLSVEVLSEGEKKLILVQSILETLSEANTLILFDEPDSHIHISRKSELKELFEKYASRDNVLTTHSPTLAHSFELNNINMLSKSNGSVQIVDKEKQKIISELTNDIWSYQEQNIVLNSHNDLLLVEGKSDIVFIKEAIKKLDEVKYKELENVEFIPTGGASGLRMFIDKFIARDNQNIIAILDNDKAGKEEVKEILTDAYLSKLRDDGFVKINEHKNTFLLKLPKLDRINNSQYEIEDYFPLNKLIEISKKEIDTYKVLKDFVFNKKTVKRKLSSECKDYNKEDFNDFKVLFDLILKIKEN